MTMQQRVAIAGFGAIGREIAQRLRGVPGFELVAVADLDTESSTRYLQESGLQTPLLPLSDLEPLSDLVIEAAGVGAFPLIAAPFLREGKEVIALSSGALLEHPEFIVLAEDNGGKITIPTGALPGLDALVASAEDSIKSVRLVTRKPIQALVGAPYLREMGIDAQQIAEPTCIFAGSAREAVTGFPANVNVAASLSLASIGPDLTEVEIWADPTINRNTHQVEVRSDVAILSLKIESVSTGNPRSSAIAPLSVISLLRKRVRPLVVGS